MKYKNFTKKRYQPNYHRAEVSLRWSALLVLPIFLMFVFYISILGFDTYDSNIEPMEITGSFKQGVDSIKVWVKIEQDKVITNISGNIVSWPYEQEEVDTSIMSKIFKREVQKRQLLSFLRKKDSDNLSVSIIADGSLRYMHIIPVIQAMANVGISDYRFLGEKAIVR